MLSTRLRHTYAKESKITPRTPGARITGIGSYVPSRVVTNEDLEETVDTSDEWIRTRTGIVSRRVVDENTATSDLATEAARAALADSAIDPSQVDLLVVATGSPDMLWPSTACIVQHRLGLCCPAFDLSAACSGFVYGLSVVQGLIESGHYSTVVLVGADALSRHLDWSDRSTCILFGDGAGAVVVMASDESAGLLGSVLRADGSGADLLKIPAGANRIPPSTAAVEHGLQYIAMNGREVFKFAVRTTSEVVGEVLSRAEVLLDEVKYLLLHQANQRITDAVGEVLGLPAERVPANIDRYGNTSSASIPLLADELYREGRLKEGDIVVLVGFGAGLTWGATVVRWTKGGHG